MDRKQKAALVLALAEKGKTYREIAREVGVSPNTIKAILNRAGLDQTTSISARVFELYTQQKTPLQVAIILGLKAEDAIRYHREYFMLLGCTEFTKVYPKIKDNPWPYVNLVKLALNSGMGDDEVVELLRIANNDLPRVRLDYDRLKDEKNSLEANVQQAERTLQEITDRTSKESKTLEHYRSIYSQIKEETENLNTKKARIETAIDSFHNDNEVYIKFRQMIKREIESIISNPRRLLEFALASIFESSRKHPGKLHAMYYNMPTIRTMRRSLSRTPVEENHRQDEQYEQYVYQYATDYDTSKSILLYEAELLYNQMIEESMNMCSIDDMTNNTESVSEPLIELPDVQYDDQHGHEDKSKNALVLESDSCSIKVLFNNTSSQIHAEDNDVEGTR